MAENPRHCTITRISGTDWPVRKLSLLVSVVLLFQVPASGQQVVWNRSTGVTIHLPEMWKQVSSWQLDNPDFSLYHVINEDGGAQISVRREPCTDPSYRADWVSGAGAAKALDPNATIEPIPVGDLVRIKAASGVIATVVRDTTTYKSRSFFLAKGDRCYLAQFIGLAENFDTDAEAFAKIAGDLEFEEPGTDRAVLRISAADSAETVEFEADFSDGSGITRASTPYTRVVSDQTWTGLIRTAGSGALSVQMDIEAQGWHGECNGTTLFFERRDRWGFCRGM